MQKTIRYCPACGQDGFEPYQNKAFQCNACGFLYYHNIAATSSALISVGDELLLVTRAHEPQQGMLDLPGGFIEKDETAEQGLLRELAEELGLALSNSGRYLCSSSNRYQFAGVVYNTLDMFFHIAMTDKPSLIAADDVSDYRWLAEEDIDLEAIAFASARCAIEYYREQR